MQGSFPLGETNADRYPGPLFPDGHISYSQIETYLRCPYAYYLKYVARLETPPSPYATVGRIWHAVFEADGRHQLATGRKLALSALVDRFHAHWRASRPERADAAVARRLYERGLLMLRAFARRPAEPIVAVERRFRSDIGVGLPVIGVIDKAYRDGETLVITDYKTGRAATQRDADESLQLSLYALAAPKLFGAFPGRLELDFVRERRVVRSTRSQRQLAVAVALCRDVIARIRRREFDAHCGERFWCENVCEFGRARLCKWVAPDAPPPQEASSIGEYSG